MGNVELECTHFEWVHESELPHDWESIINHNFSQIADYYYASIVSDEASKIAHHTVDEEIRRIIQLNGLSSLLDVGIGDGSRLLGVSPVNAELHGLEISETMADASRQKGITVKIHDFKKGLPFGNNSLDMVLFLSNDFGYIMDMDPQHANELRQNALQEAYRILRPGGFLYMELMTNDSEQTRDGLVCKYDRVLRVDGKERFKGSFYLKDFTYHEMERLLKHSRFIDSQAVVKYLLSKDFQNPEYLSQVGRIVKTSCGFEEFVYSDFQPTIVNPITNEKTFQVRYDYLMLISVQKKQ